MSVYLRSVLAAIIMLMVSLLSCVSTSPAAASGTVAEETENNATELRDVVQPSVMPEWAWVMVPVAGKLRFVTVALRRYHREEEKELCLKKAAIQAAKYRYLKGSFKSIRQKTSGGFGHLEDLQVDFNKELPLSLLSKLKVVRESQDEYATYLLAELESASGLNLDFTPEYEQDVPLWVTETPQIPGYLVSVGLVRKSLDMDDSWDEADNSALEGILKQVNLNVQSLYVDKATASNTQGAAASAQETVEYSSAVIQGFYILARWKRPDKSYYYSLAICPENQDG